MPSVADAADKVVLMLNWYVYREHAPFCCGVEKGYYKAEGIDLDIEEISKSFDTFCPPGPVVATDLDPGNLLLETFVNGERRQSVRTSDLLFSVIDLLVYISRAVTLMPGDVILTGTPFGVGPIVPGDVVDVTVEGVGTLHNPAVRESEPA